MALECFEPSPELWNVCLMSSCRIDQAAALIHSCEQCDPEAEIPFDWVLDGISGKIPGVTAYLFEKPARCGACSADVFEKTLVRCE
jgi:hypothetical protein